MNEKEISDNLSLSFTRWKNGLVARSTTSRAFTNGNWQDLTQFITSASRLISSIEECKNHEIMKGKNIPDDLSEYKEVFDSLSNLKINSNGFWQYLVKILKPISPNLRKYADSTAPLILLDLQGKVDVCIANPQDSKSILALVKGLSEYDSNSESCFRDFKEVKEKVSSYADKISIAHKIILDKEGLLDQYSKKLSTAKNDLDLSIAYYDIANNNLQGHFYAISQISSLSGISNMQAFQAQGTLFMNQFTAAKDDKEKKEKVYNFLSALLPYLTDITNLFQRAYPVVESLCEILNLLEFFLDSHKELVDWNMKAVPPIAIGTALAMCTFLLQQVVRNIDLYTVGRPF